MSGIKKTSATTPKTILYCADPYVAVPAVIAAAAGSTVGTKKIVKAGTPVSGDLTARTTAFGKAATASTKIGATAPSEGDPVDVKVNESNAIGVVLHDIDVTDGNENGTVLLFGFVDLNKLDTDVAALITDEVKAALAGKITFLK